MTSEGGGYLVAERLETPRLLLRLPREPDWRGMHEHYSDRLCTRYTFGRELTEAESWRALASLAGHWLLRGYGPYAVEERVSGAFLGIVGLWYPNDWPGPEIKWAILRRHWKRGFAREAAQAVWRMAARALPKMSLISLIDADNGPSIRTALAVGARFEREMDFRGGRWHVYRYPELLDADAASADTGAGRTAPLLLRKAIPEDVPALTALIAASARALGRGYYTEAQIEAAVGGAFGVDTQLIADGTYLVAEAAGEIVGGGGWSWRRTLFGADDHPGRSAEPLEPRLEAARLRAFFVRTGCERRGIAGALLQRCEDEMRARGFVAAELMATLPGERFYRARGFVAGPGVEHLGKGDVAIDFVPMRKTLSAIPA